MSKGHRVGYIRVSSVDQNTERQLDGMTLDKTFTDKASGKNTDRPELQKALDYVRSGDTLVVHSIDRAARNTANLLDMVASLNAKGVTVEFVKEGLTFRANVTDPMADLMMTMLAGFAQFERAMIRERQREGIAIAKAKGDVYKGRAPKLNAQQIDELRKRCAAGDEKAAVARSLNISRVSLYRYLRGADGSTPADRYAR
ncbi:recombinase family protein [Bradyrhizobium sp. Leo170]|uniref:recombinase family protein n=1 Tax=Bradyrhizobium sp. Leo170 TaxID=1571199 RepID=UPI00102EC2EC|nr:recombinase family protein [Bradyrhizobium sp. Leo170]TAI63420.1 transposase [Bradyrhizobium sp. Leo170]